MKKELFIQYYKGFIKREGADELLKYLENTDFFVAPASSRFHGSYEGGLVEHSVNVFQKLTEILGEDTSVSTETIAITGLLHDACKINLYKKSMRNVKEDGVWVQKPFYMWDEDRLVYGHGAESVMIVSKFMKLTDEEVFAIRYHMGAYVPEDMKALINVYRKYPLAYNLHRADNESNLFIEK